jgi:hypothetical protein
MTPKYWFKIVLGMLGIFLVGMLIQEAFTTGKSKVEALAEGTESISIPMLGMPFRTAAGDLGSIQRLHVDRSAPKQVSGFRLAVTLNDGVDVDQFDDCEITVSNPEMIDEHTAFTCLTSADSGFSDLVQFGTITFRPSGEVHRLMVPESVRDEIRQAGREPAVAAAATADASGATDGTVEMTTDSSTGRFSLKVNGRQLIDIRGDSSGGTVLIIDPETGKKLVDIKGGEGGASITIDTPPTPPAPATGGRP